jgi:hypothetical protein
MEEACYFGYYLFLYNKLQDGEIRSFFFCSCSTLLAAYETEHRYTTKSPKIIVVAQMVQHQGQRIPRLPFLKKRINTTVYIDCRTDYNKNQVNCYYLILSSVNAHAILVHSWNVLCFQFLHCSLSLFRSRLPLSSSPRLVPWYSLPHQWYLYNFTEENVSGRGWHNTRLPPTHAPLILFTK